MKSYVVIGLGRFGSEIAVKLFACGEEVLAIDLDETIVDKIADRVTRAVAADAQDRDVLEKLGVKGFDRAIVAIGSDLAASAMVTMNLKDMGVPYILCKAQSDTHREILKKLGADQVVIPEWEMADKIAMGLSHTGVMEYIELSSEIGIVEMLPPARWVGKTIRNLEIRSRYGANIIALRREDRIQIPVDIDTPLEGDCVLVVLGNYESLEKMKD